MQFRKDINGLRAIAVMAVVLFHFNESWMPGGFAGVDVFFVISGFLMTGIIFSGLEKDTFSIFKFYVSRANRIIPSLAVLCSFLLVFGWFFVTPIDYKVLGKHVASSVSFVSNFVYWKEAGYFDAASHKKWLLHTWSLSVEWQFYIFYPLVIVGLRKFFPLQVVKRLVFIFTVVSFIVCVVVSEVWPSLAYYLLPSRMWELMLGGLAFLYPIKIKESRRVFYEILGIILIFVGCFYFSKQVLWPGYLSVIPVFGAFLIIQAHSVNSVVTGNFIFQKIGRWSYSIYLWHWPFVVAVYYYSLSFNYVFLGLFLSILFGFLNNRFVEGIKFSNEIFNKNDLIKCKPIYMSVFVFIISFTVFITNGFVNHYSDSVRLASYGSIDKNPRRYECLAGYGKESKQCEYKTGKVDVVVIGDSHAQSLVPIIAKIVPNKTLDWTLSSCRTIEDIFYIKNGYRYSSCGEWVSKALKELPKGVPVIVHNWLNVIFDKEKPREYVREAYGKNLDIYREIMAEKYIDTMCGISKTNPVIVIKDTPYFSRSVPSDMAINIMIGNEGYRVSIPIEEYKNQNKFTDELYYKLESSCKGITFIEPSSILCDDKNCYGDSDGKPLYFDSNHLSTVGAELFEKEIKNKLLPIFEVMGENITQL